MTGELKNYVKQGIIAAVCFKGVEALFDIGKEYPLKLGAALFSESKSETTTTIIFVIFLSIFQIYIMFKEAGNLKNFLSGDGNPELFFILIMATAGMGVLILDDMAIFIKYMFFDDVELSFIILLISLFGFIIFLFYSRKAIKKVFGGAS